MSHRGLTSKAEHNSYWSSVWLRQPIPLLFLFLIFPLLSPRVSHKLDRFAWFGIKHHGKEGELSLWPLLRHIWERKEWFSLVRKKRRLTLYLFSSSGSKIPWKNKYSLNFKLLWKPYSLLIDCSSFSLIKVLVF
jgi:hypothetical protein